MNITDLLELPASDISKISNDDLINHLRPWFPLTRPKKIPGPGTSALDTSKFDPTIAALLEAAKKPSLLARLKSPP